MNRTDQISYSSLHTLSGEPVHVFIRKQHARSQNSMTAMTVNEVNASCAGPAVQGQEDAQNLTYLKRYTMF